MTRLIWHDIGERLFEVGVDRGVFYPKNSPGVPWNGLISVQEAPSGSDIKEGHYDGAKFFTQRSIGSFAATIEAYSYPLEFQEYDGLSRNAAGQTRKSFDFSYRTLVGNDVDGVDHGYLIHLVYNATTSPLSNSFNSLNNSLEPLTFNWDIETQPLEFAGRVGSHLIINPKVAYPWAVEAFEDLIYGTSLADPIMPTPEFVLDLFEDASILKITDHGDGTWTAEGPDDAVKLLDSTTFQLDWPSVFMLDDETYQASSL